MNKILLSLATIAAVGSLGVAATTAFFSDKETSSGNTFQSGKIDLQIKSQCAYNGQQSSECGVWDYKSLTTEKFFNFIDLKPGDWGENTISFKVVDNDAWMCASLDVTQNSNLGKYLSIFWWIDTNGNNIYESGEKVLYGGPRTLNNWLALGSANTLPLTFADSYLNWLTWPTTPGNITPIVGNAEQHLGVGWCFGSITLNGVTAPGFACDGTGNQDDAQNTNITGNLLFSVEQHRNNPNFRCPENVNKAI